jgi:hypothetical protein
MLQAATDIQGARTRNELAGLQLADVRGRQEAMSQFDMANPASLRVFNRFPDLYVRAIQGMTNRQQYFALENARAAQRVLGIKDMGERRIAYQRELQRALSEGRIDEATYRERLSREPTDLALRDIVDLARPLTEGPSARELFDMFGLGPDAMRSPASNAPPPPTAERPPFTTGWTDTAPPPNLGAGGVEMPSSFPFAAGFRNFGTHGNGLTVAPMTALGENLLLRGYAGADRTPPPGMPDAEGVPPPVDEINRTLGLNTPGNVGNALPENATVPDVVRRMTADERASFAVLLSQPNKRDEAMKLLRDVATRLRGGRRLEGRPLAETEAGMRREFEGHVGPYRNARLMADRLKTLVLNSSAFGSGAGDIATIYSFIKALDPNSAVLPGETANVG